MSPQFRQESLKFFVCQRNWLMRTTLAMGVAAFGASSVHAAPPSPMLGADTPFYTQGDFSLPFQVKPGGRCPQQLDLLISRDGGRSWQVHQSAAPAEGRFRFSQADEGEYWLKVQVRDAAGSSLSPSTMHLIADRTRPASTMFCDWQGDHTLLCTCNVEDAHLDPQSVTLQLRTDADHQTISVPLKVSNASATALQSHAAVDMPSCKSFELRLIALDRSGNRTVNTERYFHPVLANENDALLPATEWEQMPVTARPAVDVEIVQKAWTGIELGAPLPLAPASLVSGQSQLVSADAHQSLVRKPPRQTPVLPQELVPPERPLELTLEPPLPAVSLREVTRVFSPSRKIKINYSLSDPVPGDQLHVELWVTTDHGTTWDYWGLDRDAESPARVEVDRDGEFGFCVVCVQTEADLRFRPSAGDAPDLLVTVKEPPAVRRLQPAAR